MPRNYWMLVLSQENYRITKEQGFTVQGLPSTLKRKVQRIEVGDRMLFYISGIQRFAAAATVTSAFFEEHTRLWGGHRPDEDYPYRVGIEPAVVLDEEEFIDAMQIAPRMDYVKKWIPEWWPLAFTGDLHLIPKKDFSLIEEELEKLSRPKAERQSLLSGEES